MPQRSLALRLTLSALLMHAAAAQSTPNATVTPLASLTTSSSFSASRSVTASISNSVTVFATATVTASASGSASRSTSLTTSASASPTPSRTPIPACGALLSATGVDVTGAVLSPAFPTGVANTNVSACCSIFQNATSRQNATTVNTTAFVFQSATSTCFLLTNWTGAVANASAIFVGPALSSFSPSVTRTASVTPSVSSSPSASPSTSTTISVSPSVTPSISTSPSVAPSSSTSPSVTPSRSASPSVTPSRSASPSVTPSSSASPSASPTPSSTPVPACGAFLSAAGVDVTGAVRSPAFPAGVANSSVSACCSIFQNATSRQNATTVNTTAFVFQNVTRTCFLLTNWTGTVANASAIFVGPAQPSFSQTATPTASVTLSATPSPSVAPSLSVAPSASPSASSSASPSASPSPSSTPIPACGIFLSATDVNVTGAMLSPAFPTGVANTSVSACCSIFQNVTRSQNSTAVNSTKAFVFQNATSSCFLLSNWTGAVVSPGSIFVGPALPSFSSSITPSASVTPSVTPSRSVTQSVTPSMTPSSSASPSASPTPSSTPIPACGALFSATGVDVTGAVRSPAFPAGVANSSVSACCSIFQNATSRQNATTVNTTAFVFQNVTRTCFLLTNWTGTVANASAIFVGPAQPSFSQSATRSASATLSVSPSTSPSASPSPSSTPIPACGIFLSATDVNVTGAVLSPAFPTGVANTNVSACCSIFQNVTRSQNSTAVNSTKAFVFQNATRTCFLLSNWTGAVASSGSIFVGPALPSFSPSITPSTSVSPSITPSTSVSSTRSVSSSVSSSASILRNSSASPSISRAGGASASASPGAASVTVNTTLTPPISNVTLLAGAWDASAYRCLLAQTAGVLPSAVIISMLTDAATSLSATFGAGAGPNAAAVSGCNQRQLAAAAFAGAAGAARALAGSGTIVSATVNVPASSLSTATKNLGALTADAITAVVKASWATAANCVAPACNVTATAASASCTSNCGGGSGDGSSSTNLGAIIGGVVGGVVGLVLIGTAVYCCMRSGDEGKRGGRGGGGGFGGDAPAYSGGRRAVTPIVSGSNQYRAKAAQPEAERQMVNPLSNRNITLAYAAGVKPAVHSNRSSASAASGEEAEEREPEQAAEEEQQQGQWNEHQPQQHQDEAQEEPAEEEPAEEEPPEEEEEQPPAKA